MQQIVGRYRHLSMFVDLPRPNLPVACTFTLQNGLGALIIILLNTGS